MVQYKIKLAPGGSTRFQYHVTIPAFTGSPTEELRKLAHDQTAAQAVYLKSTGKTAPLTLATLSASPTSILTTVGGTQTITLTGTMSSGAAATAAELSGVSWASSHPTVASVEAGIVTGVTTGTAIVTAQIGSISVHINVAVLSGATTTTTVGHSTTAGASATKPSGSSNQATATVPSTSPQHSGSGTTPTTPASPAVTTTTGATPTTAPTTNTTTVAVDAFGCPLTTCKRSPDINGDGVVNCEDVAIMSSEWGETGLT